MAATPVIVIGAGGHAKVVIELIRGDGRYEIAGLVDSDPTPRRVLDIPVIGDDTALPKLRSEGLTHAFVAVGDNRRRLEIGRRLQAEGFELINAVGRSAVVSPSARLGAGVAIMEGATVNAESRIGDLVVINTGAGVDHDADLGAGVHIGPGSALAGNVTVGRLAFLGVGVRAIPGVTIGEGTVVGAGACVVSDLPAGVLAHGVPARVVRRLEGGS